MTHRGRNAKRPRSRQEGAAWRQKNGRARRPRLGEEARPAQFRTHEANTGRRWNIPGGSQPQAALATGFFSDCRIWASSRTTCSVSAIGSFAEP